MHRLSRNLAQSKAFDKLFHEKLFVEAVGKISKKHLPKYFFEAKWVPLKGEHKMKCYQHNAGH